jgi:hypothetical protein
MIELHKIGLTETTGINGKIRKLIIEQVKCRKIKVGSVEKPKQWKHSYSSLCAHYAGYSKTYEKPIYKYVYTEKNLIKWFNENKTIKFNRKDTEIDTDKFLLAIKELINENKK